MNFKNFLRKHREAFTLAEVVVVMAILSIMMVAFAPVVTKKTSSTGDTFRTFVRTSGNDGIYYGTKKSTKPVVIGATRVRPLNESASVIPKLFLVATTNKETDTSSTYLTPQVAFITGNSNNNLEFADGQLLVVGGPIGSGSGFGAPTGAGEISFLPSYWLTQPAFADEDVNYMSPSNGVSVILGGKPNATYKFDIGDKQMTIVGGNACENADGAGVAGLTCIGANAAKGVTSIPASTIFIGHNAGVFTSGHTYSQNDIYLGNGNTSIDLLRVYIGDANLANKVCNLVTGNQLLSNGICAGQINVGGGGDGSSSGVIDDTTDGEHIRLAFDTTENNTLIPSDERLKNVGKPFTAGLDAINKITPVNFTYKRDKDKFPHVGVIAQALSPVFPNAISINKDGYFYIRTEDMFYAAINAIKELYQMYLAHDKKFQQLEERSAALEQQNKELQVLYMDLAKRLEKLDKKKSRDINFTQVPVYEEAENVETLDKTLEEVVEE